MHFELRTPLFVELGFDPKKIVLLKAYVDLLWASNEELNLISRQMTFEELIDNHVIDSLLPLQYFPTNIMQVADFGSGGGLPSVIYAIQFPHITFHLYEKSNKKQIFLNKCLEIAPNLVIHGEIPNELKSIELITARAFKPIDVILDISRKYYNSGRKYFLLKGRAEKIEEELNLARKKFKNLDIQNYKLASPVMNVERHLVEIKKSLK